MAATRKMADVGLLGMTAPKRFGGSDADTVALVTAIEEVARGDASCALVLSMANSLSILPLMTFGTAAQQAQWKPPDRQRRMLCLVHADRAARRVKPTAMKTVAERKGNRYILRGTKQFISLGSVSHLAFVLERSRRALCDCVIDGQDLRCRDM